MTSPSPAPSSRVDYDEIHDAVMATARGRWFLAEYARRNRHADTESLLDALRRIERRLAADLSCAPPHPDLVELGAMFGVGRDGAPGGLSGEAVADMARDAGATAEAVRERVLSARGALKGLVDAGADARLCAALDAAMVAIDAEAAAQARNGRRIEALATVLDAVRDRVRRLIEDAASREPTDRVAAAPSPSSDIGESPVRSEGTGAPRAPAGPESQPDATSPAIPREEAPADEPVPTAGPPPIAGDEAGRESPAAPEPEQPAFESGLPLAAVGPGARLRLAISDEEQALRDMIAASRAGEDGGDGLPRTLADLDRLSYAQRHALFAS